MRLLIAADSFKESCSAETVCASIALGVRRAWPEAEVDACPLADGGEGTIAAIVSAASSQYGLGPRCSGSPPHSRAASACATLIPKVELEPVVVTGPLGEPAETQIAWVTGAAATALVPDHATGVRRTAWLEAAGCLGLGLVPESRRDPLVTTTYGLGELILHARRRGADTVIVGLGGTSTVDCGLGMAQALGAVLPGIPRAAGGSALVAVGEVELEAVRGLRSAIRVFAATDVKNPLLGPRGAARAFGPQKGASPRVVEELELGMAHYGRRLFDASAVVTSRAASPQVATTDRFQVAACQAGAGAAGGLGFALVQLLGAELTSGIELVMECVGFDERVAHADAVITGEGCIDHSSFEGKVVSGVLGHAAVRGVPVFAIAGSSDPSAWTGAGLSHVDSLLEHARDLSDAKARTVELLVAAGERLGRRIRRDLAGR